MAYTTIDDPSAHSQGLFFTGTGSAHKISYDGNASSYIPDIYFVKNMVESHHPQHTDSVRTGGITSANEHAGYGSRDMDILDELASDGYTVGTAGQGNGNTYEHMVLTWNAGSTATITTTGNNITSVSASGSAVAHSYTVNTTSPPGALILNPLEYISNASSSNAFIACDSGIFHVLSCGLNPLVVIPFTNQYQPP